MLWIPCRWHKRKVFFQHGGSTSRPAISNGSKAISNSTNLKRRPISSYESRTIEGSLTQNWLPPTANAKLASSSNGLSLTRGAHHRALKYIWRERQHRFAFSVACHPKCITGLGVPLDSVFVTQKYCAWCFLDLGHRMHVLLVTV
jgi:hypothetical protein